jgi:hypothetical protein
MIFVYILAGWEGSAHDSRALADAQSTKGFITPIGKYWLGKWFLKQSKKVFLSTNKRF